MALVNAFSSFVRQGHADKIPQAVKIILDAHAPVEDFFAQGSGTMCVVTRNRLPEVANYPACFITGAPVQFQLSLQREVEVLAPIDIICCYNEPRGKLTATTDKTHRSLIEEIAYALTTDTAYNLEVAEFPPVVSGMGLVERLDSITAQDEGSILGGSQAREGELVSLAQYVIVRVTYLYTLTIDGFTRVEP